MLEVSHAAILCVWLAIVVVGSGFVASEGERLFENPNRESVVLGFAKKSMDFV